MRTHIDLAVLALYLAAVLGIGLRARRRGGGAGEFFLAGRELGAWPLGLSVMITLFSAINFTAFPTEVAAHGLYVWASVPVFLLAAWPIARWFVPWFRAQPGFSGYAWLEARHGRGARRTAAGLFLLWRLAWMAVALHATGRVAAGMTGLPPAAVMAGATALALGYTALGGLRAVVGTDVLQFAVLCGGLFAAVSVTAARLPEGAAGLADRLREAGLLRPFHPADRAFWGWDPTMRISFWSALIGTWIAFLARYGADQMILQRYRAARSVRAAQRGIWINAWAAVAVMALLTLLGFAVALGPAPETQAAPARLAALFRALPPGAAGLVAAALVAATMSSLDSGLHACAVTLAGDFTPAGPPRGAGAHPRRWMAGLALLAFLLALPLGRLGGLFAIVNKVVNGLGAPLLAMVLLGIRRRGITGPGLAWGGALGFASAIAVSVFVTDLALHHYAVVNFLVTLLLCRAASVLTRRRAPA